MLKDYQMKPDESNRVNPEFSFPPINANDNISSPSDDFSASNDHQSDTQSINNDTNDYKIIDWLLVKLVPTLENMFVIGQIIKKQGLDSYDEIDIQLTIRKAVQLALKPNGEKLAEKDFTNMKENMAGFEALSSMLNLDDASVPTPKILSRRNSVSSLDRPNKNTLEQLDPITEEQADNLSLKTEEIEFALRRLSSISIEQYSEKKDITEGQGVEINYSNENEKSFATPETDLTGTNSDTP